MKKYLWLLLAATAFGQNVRYDNIAFGPKGPIPNATVAVCTQPAVTTTQPCTPLASLCSSLTDTTCNQPNPFFADNLGNFHFYLHPVSSPVTIQIYGPNVAVPLILGDQLAGVGTSQGGGSVFPTSTVSPSSLSFGSIAVGASSPSQTATLTNTGSLIITLASISTSGDYSQGNNCGTTLSQSASCSIFVTFSPTLSGTRTGTLTITSNAAGSPQTVSLTGSASSNPVTLSSIAVSPASPTIALPGTQQFTSTGTYSDASTRPLTNASVWNIPGGSPSSFTVANNQVFNAGSTTNDAATSVTMTTGNLLVVHTSTSSLTNVPTTPTDSQGNTFTQAATSHDNTNTTTIYYAVIKSTLANVVTCHATATTNIACGYVELNGQASNNFLDKTAFSVTPGAATTAMKTANFTTTGKDYIYCLLVDVSAGGSFVAGSGYSILGAQQTGWADAAESINGATAGTYNGQATDPTATTTWTESCSSWLPGGTTGIATISPTGLATAVVAGTATVSDAGAQFVQSATGAVNGSTTTQNASFTSPNISGDTLVAFVGWNDTTAPTLTVTDTTGNTYSATGCTASHGNGNSLAIFVANGITPATANTVTATFGAAVTNPNLVVGEYSGLAAASVVDACNITNGVATTTPSVSVTSTNATDIIVGGIASSGTVASATAPSTLRTMANNDYSLQDNTVFATGSQTVAETTTSAAFAMGAVALKSVVGTASLTITGTAPNTYFVNGATGSDSATCAQAQANNPPWATIQHAATALNGTCAQGSSGTTVQVAPGTYAGGLSIQASGSASSRLRFICSINSQDALANGTTPCTISLTNAGAQTAVVVVGANNNPPTAGNYIDLAGFEITGDHTTTAGVIGWGKFDRYYYNVVHDVSWAACGTSNGNTGMSVAANYNASDDWAIGNIIYAIPAPTGTTLPSNCTDVTGLYGANANDIFYGNLIYGTAGLGIQMYHAFTNGVVSFNTVWHNGFKVGATSCSAGIQLADSLLTMHTTTVSSNISYDNCAYGIRVYNGVGNDNLVTRNVLFNNGLANFNNTANTNVPCTLCNLGTATPTAFGFVGPYAFTGFQRGSIDLTSGSGFLGFGTSTCVTSGISPCVPTFDIIGQPRPFTDGTFNPGAWEQGNAPATWPWF